jgi:hypothetical protein
MIDYATYFHKIRARNTHGTLIIECLSSTITFAELPPSLIPINYADINFNHNRLIENMPITQVLMQNALLILSKPFGGLIGLQCLSRRSKTAQPSNRVRISVKNEQICDRKISSSLR